MSTLSSTEGSYLPGKDERSSRPGWLTYIGRFIHIRHLWGRHVIFIGVRMNVWWMLYRLKSIGEPRGHLLDLSTHTLNISVNTFVGVEAILSPTNDSQLVTRLLELMRNSQVYTGCYFFATCNVNGDGGCRLWQPIQADSQPKSSGLVLGRRPLGVVLWTRWTLTMVLPWWQHHNHRLWITII